MKIQLYILALIGLFSVPVHADESENLDRIEKNIAESLKSYNLDGKLTRIRTTPFENLYEVMIGPDVIYMSGDGRFVLKGDLLDLQEQKNISEEQRSLARKQILESIPAKEYIEFAPKKTEHILYVFTDVDCVFCRRLHQDVPKLNKQGIAVRYLAWPRNGVNTEAGNIMKSVWCAEDRQQALTDAKNDKPVESKECPNPVENQYKLGQMIGVRGTPAIYLEGGEDLRGYRSPEEIASIFNR